MLKTAFLTLLALSAGSGHADFNAEYNAGFNDQDNAALLGQEWACSAMDENSKRYVATGSDPYKTQDKAAEQCYRHSTLCYRTGCTTVRRGS